MNELISVIVPVYRVERYLNRCIESIVNQTYKNLEIILVDDGGDDNCPTICDMWKKKDDRIVVIHKKNEGLGLARNTGLKIAKGRYIAFVDSDDFIDCSMYNMLINAIYKNEADSAFCGYYYTYDNKIVKERCFSNKEVVWTGKNEIKALLLDFIASDVKSKDDDKYGATVWKALFSADIIKNENIKFYSEREYASEDGLFDIDYFSCANKVVLIPGCYYYYQYNPNSLTSIYRNNIFEKNKKLYALSKSKLWDNYQDSYLITQYNRKMITSIRTGIIQEVTRNKGKKIDAIKNIRRIRNDSITMSVLNEYPWIKLPLEKRVICFLIKYNMILILYMIIKLKYFKIHLLLN